MFLVILLMITVLPELNGLIPIRNDFECTGQDCLSIKEILIPEFVCTSDLPVFYEDNAKQRKIIFLTKLGTLRNDTEEIDCLNTPDEFQINEYTIERTKKKVIVKKTSVIPVTRSVITTSQQNLKTVLENLKIETINLQKSSNFLENLYIEYVEKNATVKMIRDFIELFICLMVLIYFICHTGSFSEALKKYFKFLKNKSSLNAFPNVSNIIQFKPDLSKIKGTNEYNAPNPILSISHEALTIIQRLSKN